eukprot:3605580-Prymnesium_polylepis.1
MHTISAPPNPGARQMLSTPSVRPPTPGRVKGADVSPPLRACPVKCTDVSAPLCACPVITHMPPPSQRAPSSVFVCRQIRTL